MKVDVSPMNRNTTDIYGTVFSQKKYETILDWISMLLPMITVSILFSSVISIWNGFVPQPKIRIKILITNSLAILWILVGNFHLHFSTSAITDWIAHFLAGLAFTVSLLVHFDLLSYFQAVGGLMNESKSKVLSIIVLVVCCCTMGGLYFFLPTLNSKPMPWAEQWFMLGQPVFVGLVTATESGIIFHLIYCVGKFSATRRIRERYLPITIRRIIIAGIFGVAVSWIGALLYILQFSRTYQGYSWWQISSAIAAWHWLTVPYIFHQIAQSKRTENNSQTVKTCHDTMAITSATVAQVQC